MQPYRRDASTLRRRARDLEHELSWLHVAALRGADTAARVAALRAELDGLRTRIAAAPLPLAARVVAGRACAARWEELAGGERVRVCPRCGQNVYDLAELGAEAADGLLARLEGRRVTRVLRRPDGTVTMGPCRARHHGVAAALALAAILVLVGHAPAGSRAVPDLRSRMSPDAGGGVLTVRVVPLPLDDAAYFYAVSPPGPPARSVVRSSRAAHTRRGRPRRAP